MTDLVSVCVACGQKLTLIEEHDHGRVSLSWRHGGPADHEPFPGPAAEDGVTHLCDICSAPKPTWLFATKYSFAIVQGDEEDNYTSVDDGLWRTCTACMKLVKRRDRDGLSYRAMIPTRKNFPDADPQFFFLAEAHVQELHKVFFMCEPGEPKRVSDQ